MGALFILACALSLLACSSAVQSSSSDGPTATSSGAASGGASNSSSSTASDGEPATQSSGGSTSNAGSSTHGGAGGSTSGGGGGTGGEDGGERDVIVVLGSSTAAGTGPSDPNNAWVERYRAYLGENFPSFELSNLAVGGFTTYQIQPSDFTPPSNRPGPDGSHNITAALALDPDAIIVNLPSNDQANEIPLSEQLENYNRVAELAGRGSVLLWVTTSQPRNLSGPQLTALMDARDAINETFGEFAIDFWTPFAEPNGFIKSEYDSGDGTHLNDEAHAILAEQVIMAGIPERVATSQD